jgi:hypothetical protein
LSHDPSPASSEPGSPSKSSDKHGRRKGLGASQGLFFTLTRTGGQTKNKSQKRGAFLVADLLSFPATLSPPFVHHLPRKTPSSAHPISQKPLQKREITTQRKFPTDNKFKPESLHVGVVKK